MWWRHLPPLTMTLIVVSAVVALASRIGSSMEPVLGLFISEYVNLGLIEIRSGEWWRLVTPIFLHFGVIHLAFNMLWLWDLGGALERRHGALVLGGLILALAVTSNLAQYLYDGPAFGGMSGVVYGLLGYLWMQGQFNPRFGLYLRKPIVVMMLVWYVVCWTGLVGPIANMAHTAGLVLGVIVGFVAAQLGRRSRSRVL